MAQLKRLGNLGGYSGGSFGGQVYGQDGLAPTINTAGGGDREPHIVEINQMSEKQAIAYDEQNKQIRKETIGTLTTDGSSPKHNNRIVECVAMRGRDPANPSNRTPGANLEQRLEINPEGIANTLTTVQKDNLVLIRQATENGTIPCKLGGIADLNYPESKTRRGRVQGDGELCPTLTTENLPSVLEPWTWSIGEEIYRIRIRKLTPKECWRLMGFSDEDFEKAAKVNSNTQLYKQAGNSIVVDVLEEIFKQLF